MTRLYVLNGPDAGRSYQLKEGVNTIGRSSDNDITLRDKSVSRRHLKLIGKEGLYFVTDLKSRNGTSLGGKTLVPGIETEIHEGIPIAMGMTLVSLGETSLSWICPFLDSVGLTCETGGESGVFLVHKHKTIQKKLETLYKISDAFEQALPLKETLESILDVIVEFLVEIDTASILLFEPDTTKIGLLSSRSRTSGNQAEMKFSPEVIYRVVKGKIPVLISNSDTETADREIASTLKMQGISSVLCVPILCGADMLGVVYLHSLKKPYGFGQEDVCFFEDIARRAATFIHYGECCSEIVGDEENVSPRQ